MTNKELAQIEAKAEKNKVVGLMYRENWDDDTILGLIAGIRVLKAERKLLAMLASDKPEFDSPLIVADVIKLRDGILKGTIQ